MKPMWTVMEVAIIVSVAGASIAGCDSPTPYSAIPKVTLYYAEGESRVFVSGENYMYESINITINNITEQANYSYGLTHSTANSTFHITSRVVDNRSTNGNEKIQIFVYSADVRVEIRDDTVYFHIRDIHNSDEVEKKSPYQTMMENE